MSDWLTNSWLADYPYRRILVAWDQVSGATGIGVRVPGRAWACARAVREQVSGARGHGFESRIRQGLGRVPERVESSRRSRVRVPEQAVGTVC